MKARHNSCLAFTMYQPKQEITMSTIYAVAFVFTLLLLAMGLSYERYVDRLVDTINALRTEVLDFETEQREIVAILDTAEADFNLDRQLQNYPAKVDIDHLYADGPFNLLNADLVTYYGD